MITFHKHKKHKAAYREQKFKNAHKKHLRGKKLLIRLFAFCAFAWLQFCAFSALSTFSTFSA